MDSCIYAEVVLIGFGDIYKRILQQLIDIRLLYGFYLTIIEHERYPLSNIKRICNDNNVDYCYIEDDAELRLFFEERSVKTLVISAGNKYLFPNSVVDKDNLTIVNFHNALLPKFPGRNAPSWAIFEGEEVSGATWHIVDNGVDTGEILWQGKCYISADMRAYELARDIMNEAYNGWQTICSELLCGRLSGNAQKMDRSRKLYLSKDVPANGIVNYNYDSAEYIYRTLRSMDYGVNRIFPRCKLIVSDEDNIIYTIKRYKVVNDEQNNNEIGKTYYTKLCDDKSIMLTVSDCL